MEFQVSKSGLALPKQSPEQKEKQALEKREFGRLELTDFNTRSKLYDALVSLLDSSECNGRAIPQGIVEKNRARKEIVLQFAYTMLGDDFGYEELC